MALIEDAPHSNITYRIVGAAMAVHNEHGPGHKEEVYQRALALKFPQDPYRLGFAEEYEMPVYNAEGQLVYVYRCDFLVEEAVLVEIKAHHYPLNKDEEAQVYNYFAATDFDVALLINFGRPRLERRRLFPPMKIQEARRRR